MDSRSPDRSERGEVPVSPSATMIDATGNSVLRTHVVGRMTVLTDPLGSLVREIASGASLGSLVEMYPYGTLVKDTEAATTPFVFVAAYGYYTDSSSRDYVRARELMKSIGRWTQVDPYWPYELAYAYVMNPVQSVDPAGKQIRDELVPALPKNEASLWSQFPYVLRNNCYTFGCDALNPRADLFLDPGGPGCLTCRDDTCSCKKVMDCVARDGLLIPRPSGRKCGPGEFTVILVVDPTPPCNYHFVRSLPNGKWCDKHGAQSVCIPFDNPYEHSRNLGYTAVCQHYCAKAKR